MKISATDEEISHAAMRPPAVHRRPWGGQGATLAAPGAQARRGPTADDLRILAGVAPGTGLVVSAYLDLDPAHFALPAARESQVQAVVDAARQAAHRTRDSVGHEDQRALQADLDAVRAYLLGGFDPEGAAGVAVFASSPRDLFEVLLLDEPVATAGHSGDRPVLRPLFEQRHRGDWALLAIDRREARLLVSHRGGPVTELERLTGRVRGHRESSGAEQARVERAVENDTRHHVRRAARRLAEEHQRSPLAAVVLACGEEIRPLVEAEVPAAMRPLILGRVPYDPEAPMAHLAGSAEPLLSADEARAEAALLDRIQAEVGRGRGAVGVDAVLEALNRDGVETLLLEAGVEFAGSSCTRCGRLGATAGLCPFCGNERTAEPDLVECMLRRAVAQSAGVRFLRFTPPHPGEPAHVAAIVRPVSS